MAPGDTTVGSTPTGAAGLGKAERLILETLAQAYPAGLNKEEVAARAGYEANGGGFNNALGRLRTLDLVQGRGELKASDDLFDSRGSGSIRAKMYGSGFHAMWSPGLERAK